MDNYPSAATHPIVLQPFQVRLRTALASAESTNSDNSLTGKIESLGLHHQALEDLAHVCDAGRGPTTLAKDCWIYIFEEREKASSIRSEFKISATGEDQTFDPVGWDDPALRNDLYTKDARPTSGKTATHLLLDCSRPVRIVLARLQLSARRLKQYLSVPFETLGVRAGVQLEPNALPPTADGKTPIPLYLPDLPALLFDLVDRLDVAESLVEAYMKDPEVRCRYLLHGTLRNILWKIPDASSWMGNAYGPDRDELLSTDSNIQGHLDAMRRALYAFKTSDHYRSVLGDLSADAKDPSPAVEFESGTTRFHDRAYLAWEYARKDSWYRELMEEPSSKEMNWIQCDRKVLNTLLNDKFQKLAGLWALAMCLSEGFGSEDGIGPLRADSRELSADRIAKKFNTVMKNKPGFQGDPGVGKAGELVEIRTNLGGVYLGYWVSKESQVGKFGGAELPHVMQGLPPRQAAGTTRSVFAKFAFLALEIYNAKLYSDIYHTSDQECGKDLWNAISAMADALVASKFLVEAIEKAGFEALGKVGKQALASRVGLGAVQVVGSVFWAAAAFDDADRALGEGRTGVAVGNGFLVAAAMASFVEGAALALGFTAAAGPIGLAAAALALVGVILVYNLSESDLETAIRNCRLGTRAEKQDLEPYSIALEWVVDALHPVQLKCWLRTTDETDEAIGRLHDRTVKAGVRMLCTTFRMPEFVKRETARLFVSFRAGKPKAPVAQQTFWSHTVLLSSLDLMTPKGEPPYYRLDLEAQAEAAVLNDSSLEEIVLSASVHLDPKGAYEIQQTAQDQSTLGMPDSRQKRILMAQKYPGLYPKPGKDPQIFLLKAPS